ncbi:MAG: ribonuclease activity regulator RraA [Betaproteobacteria bacterium]|nr:MAG: ribonuclease activity regulator RraA [Betaproteobacteria bacterium]
MTNATMTDEARELYSQATTASLTAQLVKRGLRTRAISNIAPINPDTPRVFGPAYTLRYIPMREDLATGEAMANPENPQRKAIEVVPAGHVLIADTNGMDVSGTFGDILVARLKVRGVAGVVSDGPMRDIAELENIDFPVFARGNAAPPSYASMLAADAQVPIGCGGVAVFPGDIVIGDPDGIVILPAAIAEEVARAAVEQDQLEAYVRQRVESGDSIVGVYPPNEKTKADYEAWKAKQR